MKTSLKLLIVFIEYAESNAALLVQAVNIVDTSQSKPHFYSSLFSAFFFGKFKLIKKTSTIYIDRKTWYNLMQILTDLTNKDDLELILYSMILINTVLNSTPDQDTFYDVSDSLEEQGMQRVIQHYMKHAAAAITHSNAAAAAAAKSDDQTEFYKQCVQQMELYEAALLQEDGEELDITTDSNEFNTSYCSLSSSSAFGTGGGGGGGGSGSNGHRNKSLNMSLSSASLTSVLRYLNHFCCCCFVS